MVGGVATELGVPSGEFWSKTAETVKKITKHFLVDFLKNTHFCLVAQDLVRRLERSGGQNPYKILTKKYF